MRILLELVVLVASAGGVVAALAYATRRAPDRRSGLGGPARGAWPLASAVARGRGRGARELRFLAFVGGVVLVVTGALLFPGAARALGPLGLAPLLLVLLPALVLGLAAGADLVRRARRILDRARVATTLVAGPGTPPLALEGPVAGEGWGGSAIALISTIGDPLRGAQGSSPERSERGASRGGPRPSPSERCLVAAPSIEHEDGGVPAPASGPAPAAGPAVEPSAPIGDAGAGPDADLDPRLDAARMEVRAALERVSDPSLRRAAEALEELLAECQAALADPGRSGSLRSRIDGVATLARALADDELREARALLGVSPSASAAEVAEVHHALDRLYRGETALAGVDAARAAQLATAAERLTARVAPRVERRAA